MNLMNPFKKTRSVFVASFIAITFAAFVGSLSGCAHGWRHHCKHKHHACCSHKHHSCTAGSASNTGAMYAVAVMRPTHDSRVHGEVWFTEEFGQVKVQGTLYGFKPNTKHGFHVHEYGDCLAPDASSAGAHYNPSRQPHGSLEGPHEAGDFGNIVANQHGVAHISIVVPEISLNGPVDPIIGRSLIVHEGEDDLVSQPSGNSGPRIACGVIGAAGVLPKWLQPKADHR